MRDAKTKAMLVLERLQKAGAGGVTNVELTKTCLRYGARIYELRAEGHDVETVDEGRGIFRFLLHVPPRAVEHAQMGLPGIEVRQPAEQHTDRQHWN